MIPTTPTINADGTSATGGKLSTSGVILAVLGVFAAAFPKAVPVISAVQNAAPVLQAVIPIGITAVGSVLAAFGHPPAWLRKLFGK